jgi:D-aminoacyl-tRNA deacylase
MRLVVQRVKECSVKANNQIVGQIDFGLLAYLGIEKKDTINDLDYLVKKLIDLRIFNDEKGFMNLSVKDIMGSVIIVSQFTLCADTRKGNRPSYNNAEKPEIAKDFYSSFIDKIKAAGLNTQSGKFQETMEVRYINDGPVTILLDSRKIF